MPKISVIIPVYNVEKYLIECLDSVVNQTLKDIEIICVDDGSTDASGEILDKYALKDNRIKVIHKANEGVGITRNEGIEIAKGEFVCFIDPDDFYPANDILEVLYFKAKENGVLICGGEFSTFKDGEKKEVSQNRKDKTSRGYYFETDGIIEYEDYQFDYGFHRFTYSRQMLITNNIFYPPYRRFQDPPFFVKAMITAKRFYALAKITYGYRFGHQHVKWTKEKVYDLLQGITDNMYYAKLHHLEKLDKYSYIRLKQHLPSIASNLDEKSYLMIKEMSLYNLGVANSTTIRLLNVRILRPVIKNLFLLKKQLSILKHKFIAF